MIGLKCKAYYNSETYSGPTWGEVAKIGDVDLNDSRAMGESTTREHDFKSETPGPREVKASFEAVFKVGDTALGALQTAYENGDSIDMFFANAPGGAGATGKRGDFYVTQWNRKEPLDGAVKVSIGLALTTDNGHGLDAYTYPS